MMKNRCHFCLAAVLPEGCLVVVEGSSQFMDKRSVEIDSQLSPSTLKTLSDSDSDVFKYLCSCARCVIYFSVYYYCIMPTGPLVRTLISFTSFSLCKLYILANRLEPHPPTCVLDIY